MSTIVVPHTPEMSRKLTTLKPGTYVVGVRDGLPLLRYPSGNLKLLMEDGSVVPVP